MGIVRFALRFPYTFYVLAAFILFLGAAAIKVRRSETPVLEGGFAYFPYYSCL